MSEAPCAHVSVSPVRQVITEEIVAVVCVGCLEQLPAAWLTCGHPNAIETMRLCDPYQTVLCNTCGGSWKEPRT